MDEMKNYLKLQNKSKIAITSTSDDNKSDNVKITYEKMERNDSGVRRRTGFKSLKRLLAYWVLV